MKFRLVGFNTFLGMFLGAVVACGCQAASAEKQAPKKGYGTLRLHIEVNLDGTDKTGTVMVGRRSPFPLNVNKLAFVETAHLIKASLVDDEMGGFALRIQLNRQGRWLLEQYTIANKGRRIAVFAELDDFHWIAAPLITKQISDGVFTFTPDASRDEAEKLVLGLNKMIKKLRSRNTINES